MTEEQRPAAEATAALGPRGALWLRRALGTLAVAAAVSALTLGIVVGTRGDQDKSQTSGPEAASAAGRDTQTPPGAAAARASEGASSGKASTGGSAAPGISEFRVTLTSGQPFSLSKQRGGVVVLEFLAPGCVSCAEELAVLSRVAEDFKDRGVVVLVLDVSGMPRDKIAGYYRGLGAGERLLYAPDERLEVARQYQVQYLGTTVVLRSDGKETYRDGEGTELGELVAAIEAAR